MDLDDQVRTFPHITREFLQWQADPHRRQWPAEMSQEYRDTKFSSGWAPSFTAVGRMRDLGLTLIVAYSLPWLALSAWYGLL